MEEELKPEYGETEPTEYELKYCQLEEPFIYKGISIPLFNDDYGQQIYCYFNNQCFCFGAYNSSYREDLEYIIDKYLEEKDMGFMIAQKKKNNLLELYSPYVNELESFSLLKVSEDEYKLLIDSRDTWERKGDKVFCTYSVTDMTDKIFRKIAKDHKKNNPLFQDVSKTYTSSIDGTSMLVRNPKDHIIRIARRKDQSCTINKLCIDDDVREYFFSMAKRSRYFEKTHKYAIDVENVSWYKYWSKYMNDEYLKQIKG